MSTADFVRSNLVPCAGLVVGPVLWAVNTQLGPALPYSECGAAVPVGALLAFPAALLSLGAGLVAWRATRRGEAEPAGRVSAYPASFRFVGLMSGLAGLIFAYALVLQGLSSLLLTGCER